MKNLKFKLIFATILIGSPSVLFASEGSVPVRGYKITQERIEENGVLVSRPVKTDEKIVQIVSQNAIRTIEDYAAWLTKNMVYQNDESVDTWQDPADFLNHKRGDCEDFAILNQKVLSVLGYQSHILTLNSSRNAHAICAFEYNGRFYWFDNDRLKTSTATTLITFAQELTEELHYSSSSVLDPLSKRTNLLYQRS